ncbi:phosphotransferase family protein [Paenibacillaceae bacterium WGS1546]|uniref:phosphotransferase family protein n=1 Tax=Cohnella sp. WGS1546 TaxID=3366810 RepID=UPI00372D03D7
MIQLKTLLFRHYGLNARQIVPSSGGWSALAYRVETDERIFFLKMYEKNRASTPKWTALIDHYVPLLLRLGQRSVLQGKLPVPVPTLDGRCKCENDEGIYLLYEHIDGDTIGSRPLTKRQVGQLAEIVAELHACDRATLAESGTALAQRFTEDFSLPFLSALERSVLDRLPLLEADIRGAIAPYVRPLRSHMEHALKLGLSLKDRPLRYGLCHTDLHNWNLMTSGDHLILIDWEGMKLAPAEADWMFVADRPYADEFLDLYRRRHPGFTIDTDALRFYRLRRKLEDIWEFAEQLLFDEQDAEERAETLNLLQDELRSMTETAI